MTVRVEPDVTTNGRYGEVGRALKPVPIQLPRRVQWALWPMLAITLMALAVRLFRLDGQSMWSDEGLSLYRAQLNLTGILSNIIMVGDVPTLDTSPPLYFLLLAGMRALAGETTFALRYTSAALGVLSVPLIYALGRKLFAPRVGVVAALLLALSPIHVYYSQELRNYSLLLALNLLSVWLLWSFLKAATGRQRLALGVAWLVVVVLMVYTHYFALFVLAFEGLALVIGLLRRRAARLVVALLALAALVAAPLIPFGLSRLRAGPQFHFTEMPPLDSTLR